MSKTIVTALAAASKAVKEFPAAPVFDGQGIYKAFIDAGLPEDFAKRATEESERKHVAIHGNSADNLARAVINCIADSLGGIEDFARIAGRMASEARVKGKVTHTASEFRAVLAGEEGGKPEVAKIVNDAISLYAAGKAWSEIETALNLAPSSRQALYMTARDFPKSFPTRK